MAYLTYSDYQTRMGVTLAAAEQTLLTTSLIPEAEKAIEGKLGYGFGIAAGSTKYLNPFEHAKNGHRLHFPTFAATIASLTVNGVDFYTSVLFLGGGPYWGADILRDTGLSFMDYGNDPVDAIAVNAYWGYSVTVPADIVHAACLHIQGALKNRSGRREDWGSKEFYSILGRYPTFQLAG